MTPIDHSLNNKTTTVRGRYTHHGTTMVNGVFRYANAVTGRHSYGVVDESHATCSP